MIITFSVWFVHLFMLSWIHGTVYMCLFALFVGMTRQHILRPGTLFFIRSPEDPNTRLLHDALMKPFSIQLWRILQSALVYTLFILVGIGGVTFGLKAAASPLFPVRFNSLLCLGSGLALVTTANRPLLKKYIRQYWTRAFKACAAQLRLSSFILGKHDPKEGGHTVYRNVISRVMGSKPDYTQPKTQEEAAEIFKTTNMRAVFVPDGYHVRVPMFDIASRKFIRKLFVPVTKDDIPLAPPSPEPTAEDDISLDEDSDDEVLTYNKYEVVYRPPHFGTRVIMLVVMLAIFGAILFTGTILAANFVGKPLAYFPDLVVVHLIEMLHQSWTPEPMSFFSLELDGGSIAIGLIAIMIALQKYDTYLIQKHLQENADDGELANVDGPDGLFIRAARELIFITWNLTLYFTSVFLLLYWCVYIHEYAVRTPLRLVPGFENEYNWAVLAAHAIVAIFITYRPAEGLIIGVTRDVIVNNFEFGIHLAVEGMWQRLTVPTLKKFVSTAVVPFMMQFAVILFEILNGKARLNIETSAITFERVALSNNVHLIPGVVLALHLWYMLFTEVRRIYSGLNAEVKEQYYAKGKTLENVPAEEPNDVKQEVELD